MNKEINNVLITNGFVAVSAPSKNNNVSMRTAATVVNNMNFYGFTPSKNVLDYILDMNKEEIENFWAQIKPSLEDLTASDRNMGEFIVYKNFPTEVLEMSVAESVIKQILIYLGVSYDSLTEAEEEREELTQTVDYKVLELADDNTLQNIFNNLQNKTTAWNDTEKNSALVLFSENEVYVDISESTFKENGVFIAKEALKNNIIITASNATDVLRLAVEDGAVLRGKVNFKKMKRSERKFFLNLLENTKNLEEDMAMKKTLWKKFLKLLHPSDYSFKRVLVAYDKLYNNKLKSFESKFQNAMESNHKEAVKLAKSRVGFFIRNLHYMYGVIGNDALEAFSSVLEKATITQLVKLDKYLETVNKRENFLIAPNGNWKKVQTIKNDKVKFNEDDLTNIRKAISKELDVKLSELYPHGVILDERMKDVKLPSNDLELDFYGRGTSFDIPENIQTIRTASYWAIESRDSVWFDNGFNFLNDKFKPLGACCWNRQQFGKGAILSGDPINIRDLKGRACQMLDLNIDELIKSGVRYATWNVLSYNSIPFNEAQDLVLTMQMCENPLEGNTYEPSLASMVFKVGGSNLVKYVAYVDLVERKVVFLDLNIKGNTQSAVSNTNQVAELFPQILEHLNCAPSVYELFDHMTNKQEAFPELEEDTEDKDMPILIAYNDSDIDIPDQASAFIVEHVNEDNSFTKIDLLSI